jgi:hypothetical protein
MVAASFTLFAVTPTSVLPPFWLALQDADPTAVGFALLDATLVDVTAPAGTPLAPPAAS